MSSRRSRHAELPTYTVEPTCTPGEAVELYQPRIAEPPATDQVHTVRAAERLDQLADRYLGDPHLFWRVADANTADAPDDLLDPGRVLDIPERR